MTAPFLHRCSYPRLGWHRSLVLIAALVFGSFFCLQALAQDTAASLTESHRQEPTLALPPCTTLADALPGLAPYERLLQVGHEVQEALAGLPWQHLYRNFMAAKKWQEAIWLLNQNQQRALGDRLELPLRCFFTEGTIDSTTPLGGGATTTDLVTFEHGIRAVFKPKSSNLSSNVASEAGAYIVDRLLHLDMVPLTIKRFSSLHNTNGSLQYFVDDAYLAESLPNEVKGKPNAMDFFDRFVKNIDRHRGNYLFLPSLGKMVAIDNGWCLRGGNWFATIKAKFVDKRLAREKSYGLENSAQPPAWLWQRLIEVGDEEFTSNLAGVISHTALMKLLKRRHKLLAQNPPAGEAPLPAAR